MQYDTSNGRDTIPDKEPYAPAELSRFEHFSDTNYQYPGGLDKRFDMYMWATLGFPDIGGCGGDWGQRLSDTAYLSMINGSGIHVLEQEIGHGFGMTDFYGGQGESDGFPPGGWWAAAGEGVRIYHIDASAEYGWNTYFQYASGSEFTNQDQGRRLIRIIDDTNKDNSSVQKKKALYDELNAIWDKIIEDYNKTSKIYQ